VTDLVMPKAGDSDTPLIEATLASVGIDDCIDELPTSLPNGKRKLVAVARALVKRPRLVLLDEPASGLNSAESLELGATLRRLADEGLGMLLIDHDMDLVLSVSDRVYVLDFGQLIAEGPPVTLREDPRVISAYLGAGATA
jgi:branched-chain amino acid transport system ATP-binding protein